MPGSGAGISHVANADELPRGFAMSAMRVPSGEMSRPPIPVVSVTSRPDEDVRFTGSPPAMNFTHTSGRSLAAGSTAAYATHFRSGEIAAAYSRAGPVVRRVIRSI